MKALGHPHAAEAQLHPAFDARLFVSRQIFTDHKTGASKMEKRGRAAYLLYLAENIARPDEAWIGTGTFGDATLVLLSRFIRGTECFGAVAVFKECKAGWEGWTAYHAPQPGYVEKKRRGVRVFLRSPT